MNYEARIMNKNIKEISLCHFDSPRWSYCEAGRIYFCTQKYRSGEIYCFQL